MLKYPLVLFLLFALLPIVSCSHNNEDDEIEDIWTGNKISLPDSTKISALNGSRSANILCREYPYKICSFINVSCSICVMELKELQKFHDSVKKAKGIELPLIVFVTGDNKPYVDYIVNNVTKVTIPCFYDKDNLFFKANKLTKIKLFQTFLIDRDNRITLVGNPIRSDIMRETYDKTLDSLYSQKNVL